MTEIQSVGPPQEETEQERVIRGMSISLIQRLQAMVTAGVNTGDISTSLHISSSVIAMYQTDPKRFAQIRGNGVDPRNLAGGPPVGAGPSVAETGRSFRPGVIDNF